jgi:hypothetical protein
MRKRNTGPRTAVSGVVEGAKDKAKEVAGALIDYAELEHEVRAQQYRAGRQRDAARAEARAREARLRSVR